jgi:apolipoprotein N-acyltransferase
VPDTVTAHEADAGTRARLRRLRRIVGRRSGGRVRVSVADVSAAAGSALLLSAGYAGPMIPEVAFVAPACLFYLLATSVDVVAAATLGAVFGVVLATVGLWWVANVTWLGLLGLVLLFAVRFAALAAAGRWLCGRAAGPSEPGGRDPAACHAHLPRVAVLPVLWVVLEFVRAHMLTGFPWLMLGHAVSDRLALIQIADLGGAYAVSFTVALASAAGAELALSVPRGTAARRRAAIGLGAAAACVVAQAAYGAWRLRTVVTRPGPRLVLVQGNVDTPAGAESDEAHERMSEEIWREHERLSRMWAPRGELLVWSESMIPNYYNDDHDRNAVVWRGRLAKLLGELDRELLSGSNSAGPHPGVAEKRDGEYNSAFLISKDGSIRGRYDKMHLVPFGEYVPLARWPVLSGLTPYAADDAGYAHGSVEQPLLEWGGYRFGVLICYEDAFAGLARRATARGADFLVNLSSEAWFAGTDEIPQHLRLSRFRAVENRRSLVRCCNVGATGMIDPTGRIVRMLPGSDTPAGARGAVVGAVPLGDGGRTLYGRTGDVWAGLCCLAAASMVAFKALCDRSRRRAWSTRRQERPHRTA